MLFLKTKIIQYKPYIHPRSITLNVAFLQIVIAPEAFGVWIPLAVGLGIGLIYALASMARRAR